MTFLKVVLSNVKNKSSNYWIIAGLRIFVRLLGTLTMIYWLTVIDKLFNYSSKNLYDFLSTTFYLLFFVFLDWYIKTSLNNDLRNNALRWLNILKWIPLGFVVVLVYLSFQFNSFSWSQKIVENIIYSYTKVWSMVFIPNLSFIIITILIFYTSAILSRNKSLREENDLTI